MIMLLDGGVRARGWGVSGFAEPAYWAGIGLSREYFHKRRAQSRARHRDDH